MKVWRFITLSAVIGALGHLVQIAQAQVAPPCTTCAGDLNGNGIIGLEDLFGILTYYGASCPLDSSISMEPAATVAISEIHYNPSTEQGADSDFEFIELYNPSEAVANLWGWSASGAITMNFPANATIGPLGFMVLARNADSICTLTPPNVPCFEWDAGEGLNNTGETILIVRGDGSVSDQVAFEDNDGWVAAPDGGGPSLEWMDVALDNSDPASWAASLVMGGTPGLANSMWGLSDPE